MTILTDLIFMAVEAWFDAYRTNDEYGVLKFDDEDTIDEFLDEINYNFNNLRQFDNFKGGFCVRDDTRTCLTIIMYLSDENGLATYTKDFEITY